MSRLIYWLKDIYQTDQPSVGGKAANMGDLARGLNVPPGFCLSSDTYYNNLRHYHIDEKIGELLAGLNLNDMGDLDIAGAEIAELILGMPLLPEVAAALTDAYNRLAENKTGCKVAVRSSATAEDLIDASFAGLQETFLNVEGLDATLQAVKKCWASLWTPRAIHYRTQKGFEHDKVKMAVIVQEMVPAEVSGVMFTANPVTNSRNQIRIEAVGGLGEKLVSGHASGDVYIFEKNDVNVNLISKDISDPEKGQLINDYDLRELAHTGLKIEVFYGDFQDIEWSYCRGKFYFLQTRPITTMRDEDLPEIDPKKMSRLQWEVVDWVAERFPEPILPIDGVVVKVLFMGQFEAMQEYGYVVEDMDWSRVDKGIFPEFFMPPRIKAGLKRLWPYLRLGRILRSDPAREWAGEQVYLLDTLKKLKGRDVSKLPLEIVLDYITEGLHHLHFFIVMRYHYFAQNRISGALLQWFLNLVFGADGARINEDLLAGSENTTLEINRLLHGLADRARALPGVHGVLLNSTPEEIRRKLAGTPGGAEFLRYFDEFLESHGERETTMGLGGIASPTWQDSPEVVFGIIRSILQEEPGAGAAREEATLSRGREAEELVKSRLSKGLFALLPLKTLFFKILRHARSFTAFRENSHYDVTRSMHVFRILFNELGNRFIRQGLLKDPADIVYLSYIEMKEIINTIYHGLEDINPKVLAVKIESRKAEQERRRLRWSMRHVRFAGTDAVRGTPVSRGMASGAARIIKNPGEFHRVQIGDILIAPYTNPAWTPLFTTVAGLVVETGGAASHAAIIAREYGIPAVMGAPGATELFTDGEIITVNGSTGTIHRAEGEGRP